MSELLLKNVVLNFPAISAPQSIGEGAPAYGARFAIEPGSENAKALDKAIAEVAKERWKDDAKDVLAVIKEGKRCCYEEGPYRNKKTGKVFEGFEDKYNLGTRSENTQPSVYDQYGKEVTGAAAINKLLYAGCRVHAKIQIWAQDNTYGRRINGVLLGVMFAGDGERFSGASQPATASDFAEVAQAPADAADVL